MKPDRVRRFEIIKPVHALNRHAHVDGGFDIRRVVGAALARVLVQEQMNLKCLLDLRNRAADVQYDPVRTRVRYRQAVLRREGNKAAGSGAGARPHSAEAMSTLNLIPASWAIARQPLLLMVQLYAFAIFGAGLARAGQTEVSLQCRCIREQSEASDSHDYL